MKTALLYFHVGTHILFSRNIRELTAYLRQSGILFVLKWYGISLKIKNEVYSEVFF